MLFKYKFRLPNKDCYSTNLGDIAKIFNISLRTLKYKIKEGLDIETVNMTLEQIQGEYTLLPQGILVVLRDHSAMNESLTNSLPERDATLPDESAMSKILIDSLHEQDATLHENNAKR